MAWPVCPNCGTAKIHESETAPHVMPAQAQVFRSYECHGCLKILWTEEHVFCADAPTKYLRSKFALPAVSTPSTLPLDGEPIKP